ncbi:hypothetical protein AQUCO_00200865v1 [Aquilegia coerulea]|nr:hypothetical protein AQUCO_00200865v1 [Aquilegia coerulea]
MVKGTPPSPRDSHSCTTVGNNLFVFGGTDGRDPLNDLHILDTSTNTWISPSLRGEVPETREGHSAALVGKRLFVFGGCGKSRDSSNEVYYNDLYILDTENLVWRRAMTSGKQPSARDSHTCSSWTNKVIVVAGEDASDYYLSDVHILDTDTLVWKQLSTMGQKLPPRAGHSTVTLGKNLFVFGGFTDERNLYDDLYMLNMENAVWTKVSTSGQGPSARFSVAGDCLDARKGVLVFIGGCNQQLEALDDMYYLHTDIVMENGQDEPRHEKLSLRKELKRKCQEEQHLPASLSANHEDVHKMGRMLDMSQIPSLADKKNSTLYEIRSSQEQIFEAKVTEAFHYGYTIETNINGKPLRGIVFSYKPGFAHASNSYPSRKSSSDEVGEENLNDDDKFQSGIAAHTQQAAIDNTQNDILHGKESQESPLEITPASATVNATPVDVSLSHMATGNSETSTLPLSLKDESIPDPPSPLKDESSCDPPSPPKDESIRDSPSHSPKDVIGHDLPSPSPKDERRHDQPNGETAKEMFTSSQRQVVDEPASSTKEA